MNMSGNFYSEFIFLKACRKYINYYNEAEKQQNAFLSVIMLESF